MKQTVSLFQHAKRKKSLLLIALVLGTGLGLFVSGYWLADIIPPESKQLLVITLAASLLGTLANFLLLDWCWATLSEFSRSKRWLVVGISVLIGGFLLYAGTDQWLSSNRYLTFFLPSHTLRISISAPQPPTGGSSVPATKTTIDWINTSLGDISFDAISYQGWKRTGDELVLQNTQESSLSWTGKVGDKVEIVFSGLPTSQSLNISWDGTTEALRSSPGKTTYSHEFAVPFYASNTMLLLLGLINFGILGLAMVLVLWQKREIIRQRFVNLTRQVDRRFDAMDGWLLISLVVIALLMRVFNLMNVYPAVDEYYHLIAARQILQGAALSSIYPRSIWLVTLPIALALRIFGNQLWAARLIGVCLNAFAIVPLYLLTRKINRPVAVLSCFLYATSPWIVTFARIAREYAYYPFYFYWILYAMVIFVEGVPEDFVFVREWRRILKGKMAFLLICLCIPPVFALTLDWLSTFRTILIAYPLFGLFVLLRFKLRDRQNFPILAILGIGTIATSYELFRGQLSKLLPYPRLNPIPIEYFFPNPAQQWYFNRAVIVIALGILGAFLLSIVVRRLNFVPLFFLTLYLCFLGLFAFFSREFFHTRHLSTTELWYVVIVAIGLYAVWHIVNILLPWPSQTASVLLTVILGLSVLNGQQILLPIVSTNPDMSISEDYMHDLSLVQAFMINHATPNDALISTVYGLYVSWQGTPIFKSQYRVNTQTPKEYIISIVNQNPSGWIIIDKIRLNLSSMKIKDLSGIDQIEYVGLFGDEYVWHWNHGAGQISPVSLMELGR